jgi:hypothetical protein
MNRFVKSIVKKQKRSKGELPAFLQRCKLMRFALTARPGVMMHLATDIATETENLIEVVVMEEVVNARAIVQNAANQAGIVMTRESLNTRLPVVNMGRRLAKWMKLRLEGNTTAGTAMKILALQHRPDSMIGTAARRANKQRPRTCQIQKRIGELMIEGRRREVNATRTGRIKSQRDVIATMIGGRRSQRRGTKTMIGETRSQNVVMMIGERRRGIEEIGTAMMNGETRKIGGIETEKMIGETRSRKGRSIATVSEMMIGETAETSGIGMRIAGIVGIGERRRIGQKVVKKGGRDETAKEMTIDDENAEIKMTIEDLQTMSQIEGNRRQICGLMKVKVPTEREQVETG